MIIPTRYKEVKESDIPKKIQDFIKNIKTHKKGLYIHGTVGSGKTHLMYAIGKFAEDKQIVSPIWVFNSTDLLRQLREDFNSSDKYENKHLFQKLLEFRGLLMIDDIGAEKLSDWVLETFYLIINKRYEEVFPTIFTSNYPLEDLAEKVGDRTVSRIIESCDVLPLSGKDKRIEKYKKI